MHCQLLSENKPVMRKITEENSFLWDQQLGNSRCLWGSYHLARQKRGIGFYACSCYFLMDALFFRFFFFRCFSLLQTEVTLLKRLQSTKTFCRAVPAITGSFFWLVLRHFCNKLHHCTSFLNFLFILNPDVIFSLTWTKSRTLGTQLMKKNKSYEAIQVCEGTCCAPLQDPSLF